MHIESRRICDNCFLQLNIFDDELVRGFLERDEAIKIAERFQHLKEAFKAQLDAANLPE